MPYVKFTGTYRAFITGRDVDSALHYEDGSTLTNIGFVRVLKQGDEEIDEAEYESVKATIRAYNAALPPPPARPPAPDVGGYMLAIFADPPNGLGKTRAREIVRAYPDSTIALERGRYDLARAAIADMFADTFITRVESDLLLARMTTFNIPEA